jgi:hypothetical protein
MRARRATIELAGKCTVEVRPWYEGGAEFSGLLSTLNVFGGDRRPAPYGELRALHPDDLLRLAELLCFVTGYAPPQTVDVKLSIFGPVSAAKVSRGRARAVKP